MGTGGGERMTGAGGGEASVSFGGGPPRGAHPSRTAHPPHDGGPRWRARVAALARALHRILGVPDYDAYLEHHARAHPGVAPLARDEFIRRRQAERYERPGSRCC